MTSVSYCVLAVLLGADPELAVSNSELKFRFELPARFEQIPLSDADVDLIHAYVRPPDESGNDAVLVFIRRLRGALNRGKVQSSRAGSESFTESWKDLDIPVTQFPETLNGEPRVTLNALVPLTPEAIQIQVNAAHNETEFAKNTLRQLLDSLEGRTNWLTLEERIDRFVGATLQALLFIGVIAFVVFRWFKSKRTVATKPNVEPPQT